MYKCNIFTNEENNHKESWMQLCCSVLHVKGCSSSITALVTCVCVQPCWLWEVCVLADVCVCVFTHRAAGQAADIIHLLVTKRQGCWVGSRQPLCAEDGSWILIPPLLSPASHDGKSLTSGLKNKAESFSQLAAVNAKHLNHILNKSQRDTLKSCKVLYVQI